MTFKKLKELINYYKVNSDVELLSDSGWEGGSTDMDGVWYNEKKNIIIFTQDFNDSRYKNDNNYLALKDFI